MLNYNTSIFSKNVLYNIMKMKIMNAVQLNNNLKNLKILINYISVILLYY